MSGFASREVCLTAAMLVIGGPVDAQMYTVDPRKHQGDQSWNVYFGSTKDSGGRPLSGVTVELEIEQVTYVIVTDDAGRFRIEVPREATPTQVKFTCSKPGFALIRATKRPPPNKAASPIQADCVLAPRSASVK